MLRDWGQVGTEICNTATDKGKTNPEKGIWHQISLSALRDRPRRGVVCQFHCWVGREGRELNHPVALAVRLVGRGS